MMKVLITGALGGAAQGGVIQSLKKDFELRLSDYKESQKKLKHEFIKADIRKSIIMMSFLLSQIEALFP